MHKLILQLHGGGGSKGGSSQTVKQSAPGSQAAAMIDTATEGERQRVREQLGKAKGRNWTNKTNNQSGESLTESIKKRLLGE